LAFPEADSACRLPLRTCDESTSVAVAVNDHDHDHDHDVIEATRGLQ